MVKRANPLCDKLRSAARRVWLAGAAIAAILLCAPSAQAEGLLGTALKQCLRFAVVSPLGEGLSWNQASAKETPVAFLHCDGTEAHALYNALGGVVAEQGPLQEGERRFLLREFGAGKASLTRCVHLLPDTDGNSPAAFACWIGVDASPALAGITGD